MQQIYNLVVAMHLSAFDKQFLKPYAKLFFEIIYNLNQSPYLGL